MSMLRLNQRISSAEFSCVAMLEGHSLRFHKIGKDTSGKCDAYATGQSLDKVFGVVYSISSGNKLLLDEIEGLGHGYEQKTVTLKSLTCEGIAAVTYIALHIDNSLQPYHWYKDHVLRGAYEHCLPRWYIRSIEAIESVADPDHSRHIKEMLIYHNRALES